MHTSNIVNIDLEALEGPGTTYSQGTKIKAVGLYLANSTLYEVAKELEIPINTLIHWKDDSDWWKDTVHQIRKERQVELDNLLTTTIHKAINQLVDRLDNGDYKVDKQGELLRVPVSARDLSVTLAHIYDKRALIRGEATAIRQDSTQTLQSLEDRFKKFAGMLKEKDVIASVQTNEQGVLVNG